MAGSLAVVVVVVAALIWSAKAAAVLLATAVAVAAAIVWGAQASKGRRRTLRDRPELSVGEIHASYYADSSISKAVVERALGEISEDLGVPLGKLRPEDRFEVELGPARGWEFDDDLSDLAARARHRLAESGALPDVAPIRTVDDYIRLVARAENPTAR
jgi:hypothetical protein